MARRNASKLTDEQKRFLVIRLAEGTGPSTVLAAFKERWPTVELTKQAVQHYDPTTVQGAQLNKKLRVLFEARRKKYVQSVVDEPLVHQRVRVREWAEDVDQLSEDITALRKLKNYRLAAELRKQKADIVEKISKEVGGVFTNRFRHEGRAVDVLAQLLGMSPDELERAK